MVAFGIKRLAAFSVIRRQAIGVRPIRRRCLKRTPLCCAFLTLTAQQTQDQQWRDLAKRLILYINTTLWQPDVGIFSGSQSADEEYYEPGPYSRASREAPHVDKTVYTAWNARMISSYLLAAQLLQLSFA